MTGRNRRDRGDGGIDTRGENRHRLRWRVGGKRHSKTFKGSLTEARRELRRLLKSADDDQHVAPDQTLIADYLLTWISGDPNLSPKTRERYKQLAERQIVPHLGKIPLQKLRPLQISDWHNALLKTGIAARTVGHAHRVLHRGLERALKLDEILLRNVAHSVTPPKVQGAEVEILTAEQVSEVLHKIGDHPLHAIVQFALTTGMRRGEICGLALRNLSLDTGKVKVERSLEETEAGLRIKSPKTRHGYRAIVLPNSTVEAMREHCRRQLEQRLRLGLGKPCPNDLVFSLPDGSPYPPDKLSRDWGNLVRDRKLPQVMFHALRHSHASALIAAGIDIVAISRRLGHSSPAITLRIYAHLFDSKSDDQAASAIDKAFGS